MGEGLCDVELLDNPDDLGSCGDEQRVVCSEDGDLRNRKCGGVPQADAAPVRVVVGPPAHPGKLARVE